MSSKNKYVTITFLSILAISVILAVSLSIPRNNQEELSLEPGLYFRSTYGFLGVNSEVDSIELQAFLVGDEENFKKLEDYRNLSFDIQGIDITAIHINEKTINQEIRELTITLSIDMQISETTISHLNISQNRYEIGSINLKYYPLAPNPQSIVSLSHGSRTSFIGGSYYLEILEENDQSFEIRALIFEHEKMETDYSHKALPIRYNAGERLFFELDVDISLNTYEFFVFRPIMQLSLDNYDTNEYFIPYMMVRHNGFLEEATIIDFIKS